MTKQKSLGLILGAGVALGVAYLWYKNRLPKFRIIEFNHKDKTIKWQYGQGIYMAQAGQNNAYNSRAKSDFYVNVDTIEDSGKAIGMRFTFLGKDQRAPKFVYFN